MNSFCKFIDIIFDISRNNYSEVIKKKIIKLDKIDIENFNNILKSYDIVEIESNLTTNKLLETFQASLNLRWNHSYGLPKKIQSINKELCNG